MQFKMPDRLKSDKAQNQNLDKKNAHQASMGKKVEVVRSCCEVSVH